MKEQVQPTAMRRVSARYEGRVQGVGFRFNVARLSARFPVTGFVRNEDDGTVSLVAEGDETVLQGFLGAIRLSPLGRYIAREQLEWSDAAGGFKGFGIRY